MDNKLLTSAIPSPAETPSAVSGYRQLPCELQHLQPQVDSLREKYTDIAAFTRSFRPDKLMSVNDDKRAVLSTRAPLMVVLSEALGESSAVAWIMQVLSVFNEYCGKREKLDDWQIEQLAANILKDFGDLKTSELMLFLCRYANGHYGPLYGVVDTTDLMHNLMNKFIPWRAKIIQDAENEKARAERESWHKRPGILTPKQVQELRERLDKQWQQENGQ